jgi:hypothetical protein
MIKARDCSAPTYRSGIFNRLEIVWLGIILSLCASACTPAQLNPDLNAFLNLMRDAQIPVNTITNQDSQVIVQMAYGAESDAASKPDYHAHVIAIAEAVCKYAPKNSLEIQFSDGIYISVKLQEMNEFCEDKITADNLKYEYVAGKPR